MVGVREGGLSRTLELWVEGMTCASCVARVAQAARRVPGVEDASVDFATMRATVRAADSRSGLSPDALVRAIGAAGYDARPIVEAPRRGRTERAAHEALEVDVLVAGALTIPLVLFGLPHGLLPGADGPVGRLVRLALATVIALWPGRRILRAAVEGVRRRALDTDSLVGLGVTAALAYSALAVMVPAALGGGPRDAPHPVFFEVVGVVVTFVLLARSLRA